MKICSKTFFKDRCSELTGVNIKFQQVGLFSFLEILNILYLLKGGRLGKYEKEERQRGVGDRQIGRGNRQWWSGAGQRKRKVVTAEMTIWRDRRSILVFSVVHHTIRKSYLHVCIPFYCSLYVLAVLVRIEF